MNSDRSHRLLVLAAAAVVALPLSAASTVRAAAPTIAAGSDATVRTVTLITGDRVVVREQGDRKLPMVQRGEGRRGIRFAVTRTEGHLHVVPSDAMSLIGQGRLDRRLFDVTTLLSQGLDRRSDLPLLVAGGSAAAVASLADDAGGTVTRRLPGVDAVALRQPKRSLAGFWAKVAPRAAKVWLDGVRKPLLDVSVPQIGAPAAWQAGFTGKGVKVAVLDTGIDATHPDLKDRIGATRNFTSDPDANDTVGHGTHVASILAGTGAASGGRYQGVAPGAELLIGKVCLIYGCPESAILAGMQWAAESGAKVVNLSLGGWDSPEVDPVEQAVNDLTARYGTLFVISAGNSGYRGEETVASPASADAALAVGAVDKSDLLADFSSRGPRVGDGALKPELVAPGVGVVAARSKDGRLGTPGESYASASGTSMSAPHVAGAAAILAQQHPSWDAEELRSALVGSAKTLPGLNGFAQGAGRVDVGRAVNQPGYATPATVSAGVALWPHHDDEPIRKPVTYHNPGDQPVTYQLAWKSMGPDGRPAAQGMFTSSAATVTVPAGGTATVDMVVDTRVHGADGRYTAWLTATSADARITTPVAVYKEVESYQLTVNLLGADGEPTLDYAVAVLGLNTETWWAPYEADGSVTARLPADRYHVMAYLDTPGYLSMMTHPTFQLDRDRTLTLDARTARPNEVRLPDPAAVPLQVAVGYMHNHPPFLVRNEVTAEKFSQIRTAHLGPGLPRGAMLSGIAAVWAIPDANGDFRRSPRLYRLSFLEHGHLLSGFSKDVVLSELATVKSTYHVHGTGKWGSQTWWWQPSQVDPEWVTGFSTRLVLPIARTEYLNPSGGDWMSDLIVINRENRGEAWFTEERVRSYQAGRVYRESWNAAVSGPTFTGTDEDGAGRRGTRITVGFPTAGDGFGHAGFWFAETGSMKLYREGVKIGGSDDPGWGVFTVPAGDADFRLVSSATRTGTPYSTRWSCTWTFHSEDAPEGEALPLMTLGFAPKVDLSNRAAAGRRQLVPIAVRSAAGQVTVTRLSAEVSFDDGKTWKRVRVVHRPGGWFADIYQPSGRSYVSLRAKAVDSHGNTVKTTIIRAYGLK